MLATGQSVGIFLIDTLFDMYIFIMVLRLMIEALRVPVNNPICDFSFLITQPLVQPFEYIMPQYRGLQSSTLLVVFGLILIKLYLVFMLQFLKLPSVAGVLVWGLGELTQKIFNLCFFVVLISIILSWVIPPGLSPLGSFLDALSAPILRPFRRVIPPISGFDISPIPALIVLQLAQMILSAPLMQLGFKFAMGA